MTAHTTPRMIIIYKKKVIRKKKRKSGFQMKDINSSIFFILLSDSFLILLTLVKTYCNTLAKAPYLVLVLKLTMDRASCQSWPVCQVKMLWPTSTIPSSKEELNFQSKTAPSGWVHTESPHPFSPCSWVSEEAAGAAQSPKLFVPLLVRQGAHASQESSSRFSWKQLSAKQEPSPPGAGEKLCRAHSSRELPQSSPETPWKPMSPPRMLQSSCHYCPSEQKEWKTANVGTLNQGFHSS